MAVRGRTHHSLGKSLRFISRCILKRVFVMRGYLVPSIFRPAVFSCRRVRFLLHQMPSRDADLCSQPNLVVVGSSILLYSRCKDDGIRLQVSSITSSSSTPAGVLPSLKSFSSLVISARLFAFLIRASNLAFSFSFSLTFGCLAAPLASGAM